MKNSVEKSDSYFPRIASGEDVFFWLLLSVWKNILVGSQFVPENMQRYYCAGYLGRRPDSQCESGEGKLTCRKGRLEG